MISKTDEIQEKYKKQIEKLPSVARKKFLNDKLIDSIKFANSSKYTLQKLVNEGEKSIKNNFTNYLNGYTDNIEKIIKRSGISTHINKLQQEKFSFHLLVILQILTLTLI
ncbi:MAG: hypothetical protein IPI19_16835 [Ignavibacteriales bacterium]|nr:hypothetical protein [Ignavibacteriales bacterium]